MGDEKNIRNGRNDEFDRCNERMAWAVIISPWLLMLMHVIVVALERR